MISKSIILFLIFFLFLAQGCSSGKKGKTANTNDPIPIVTVIDTTKKNDFQKTVTLYPDSISHLTLGDSTLSVSFTFPSAIVSEQQTLTVKLKSENDANVIKFDPPLDIKGYASLMINRPGSTEKMYPFLRMNNSYKPIQFSTQPSTVIGRINKLDEIWFGDTQKAEKIRKKLILPAGVDCQTLFTLDDINDIINYYDLNNGLGSENVDPKDIENIAKLAANELNRLLNEPIPADNPCGYYFTALTALGRFVALSLFGGLVDVNKFKTRIEDLLNMCPLDYIMDIHMYLDSKELTMDTKISNPLEGRLGQTTKTIC